MRIGELASKAGVNIQTIRFYERRKLLPDPARTASGYRSYEQADLEKVQFIKWSQRLGFTLREVRQLLQLHSAVANLPSSHLSRNSEELQDIIHMAEEKLASIDEKLGLLKTMGEQLTTTIRKLQGQTGPVCPASKPRSRSHRRR
jgi:MerR family mercuric resistance operon transcriptional regulator